MSFSFGHRQPLSPFENRSLVRWRLCVGQVVGMMVGERRALWSGAAGRPQAREHDFRRAQVYDGADADVVYEGVVESHGLGSALA